MTFYMSLQGGRAVLNKFSYGKASPLTLLYTNVHEKGTFRIPSIDK